MSFKLGIRVADSQKGTALYRANLDFNDPQLDLQGAREDISGQVSRLITYSEGNFENIFNSAGDLKEELKVPMEINLQMLNLGGYSMLFKEDPDDTNGVMDKLSLDHLKLGSGFSANDVYALIHLWATKSTHQRAINKLVHMAVEKYGDELIRALQAKYMKQGNSKAANHLEVAMTNMHQAQIIKKRERVVRKKKIELFRYKSTNEIAEAAVRVDEGSVFEPTWHSQEEKNEEKEIVPNEMLSQLEMIFNSDPDDNNGVMDELDGEEFGLDAEINLEDVYALIHLWATKSSHQRILNMLVEKAVTDGGMKFIEDLEGVYERQENVQAFDQLKSAVATALPEPIKKRWWNIFKWKRKNGSL